MTAETPDPAETNAPARLRAGGLTATIAGNCLCVAGTITGLAVAPVVGVGIVAVGAVTCAAGLACQLLARRRDAE